MREKVADFQLTRRSQGTIDFDVKLDLDRNSNSEFHCLSLTHRQALDIASGLARLVSAALPDDS